METLYRKYRPQKFAELVGQNHIRAVLEGELTRGRIAHAYLFTGPRGVGKTTVARILAKAVNCVKRKKTESEPCGDCEACLDIGTGRALDIVEIDAASNTGVDHVREHIIANAQFAPSRWTYKVFIIDEAHMLSTPAFNALLKTLEEPPAHAIFILATTELHKVPETIVSRCQQFGFKKMALDEIVHALKGVVAQEKVRVEPAVLDAIARAAQGGLRDALSLLGQVLVLDGKEITLEQASLVLPESHRGLVLELVGLIVLRNAQEAVRLINRLVDEGVELESFTKETIEILREILLQKLAEGDTAAPRDVVAQARDAYARLRPHDAAHMIERMNEARRALDRADIPQLPLELAAVELCFTRSLSIEGREQGEGAVLLTPQ